jgi:fatty acid desaturase
MATSPHGLALHPAVGWVTTADMEVLRPTATRLSTPEHDVPLVRFAALAVIAASSVLVSSHWPTELAAHGASLALAILAMWCLDNVAHDAVHGHLGRPARNRVLGVLSSLAVLSPFSLYRAFHLEHHARTATVDDPEGRHVVANRFELLALPLVGVLFWAGQLTAAARTVAGRSPRYVRTTVQRRAIRTDAVFAWAALAALVAAATRSPAVRWGWAVPLAVYLALGQPFFTLYEHYGAEAFDLGNDVRYPLNLTRTVETWGWVSWLLSRSNLHAAHHAFPQVPGDHLPALDAATAVVAPAQLRCRGFVRFLVLVWRSLGWRRAAVAAGVPVDATATRALLDR